MMLNKTLEAKFEGLIKLSWAYFLPYPLFGYLCELRVEGKNCLSPGLSGMPIIKQEAGICS